MTSTVPSGFIIKSEATKKYRRSPRQLTRDITEAVTLQKQDVLPHLVLRTNDDMIHNASDLTLDRIKDMKVSGLSPTWFVRDDWMRKRFTLRDGTEEGTDEPEEATRETPDQSNEKATQHSSDYVELLKQQNLELKEDKNKLLSLVEELTENQKQSNVLLKQHQDQMKRQQDHLPALHQDSTSDAAATIDITPAKYESAESASTSGSSESKAAAQKKSARSRSGAKRVSRQGKSKGSKAKARPKKQKTKWYNTPLSELLSRNS